MADLVLAFVSAEQRADPTYLADVAFTAEWTGGGTADIEESGIQYSTDGGTNWTDGTYQRYDRRHSPGTDGEIAGVGTPATEYGLVWDAFADLPEGDFSAKLRVSFEVLPPDPYEEQTFETAEFDVTTVVAPLDEDRLASSLDKRRLSERIDDFLGAGPVAPLRRGGSDFMTGRGRELVGSAIWQILNTRAATERWGGELPWDPAFGSLLWTLRHGPADEITEELAHAYAQEALAWEPRVLVEGVETQFFDKVSGRGLRCDVGYSLIAENAPANQVILPATETVEVEV